MSPSFASPIVVCRPALPSDKADVLEFTKFTWDFDRDYIKYVWDEWLADPHGFLAAAEYGGQCVGIAKASLSAPGQWWLQGFRVDPKFQGLHIGSHLHDYINGWWLEHGDGVVRFMTSSKRVKVHHLAEKLNYEKILEMKELEASVLHEPCDTFQPVGEDEIQDALQLALDSSQLAASRGLFDVGWDVIHPDEEIIAGIQNQGMAFWWRNREGLLLIWEHWSNEGNMLGISLPACETKLLPEFLWDVRELAAQQGYIGVFWIAPLKAKILSAAEAAEYVHRREHDNYLYEKIHPGRP